MPAVNILSNLKLSDKFDVTDPEKVRKIYKLDLTNAEDTERLAKLRMLQGANQNLNLIMENKRRLDA